MTEYRFVTVWRVEATLQSVFDAVSDSLRWPDWWSGAQTVTELAPGNDDGVGSVRRYRWKSRLHYHIAFNARATRIEPLRALEASIEGDLEGCGCWSFSHQGGITTIHHEWNVRTTRRWMNLAAPLARTLFSANHHALMRQGAEGLARHLGARLVSPQESQSHAGNRHSSINWADAVFAGIAAGIIATIVQLALWWGMSYAVPDLLLRDARFAAAIVLGHAVLPPPATFDWRIMLAASTVHFTLSVGYGLLLAPLLPRLQPGSVLAAGTAFGLLLYAVNMYGFTVLFPWFAANRDWITAAAHAAFGITAATVYKYRDDREKIFWRKA